MEVVKDTRLINIGFVSHDPALAADVANALARAYVQLNQSSKSSTLSASVGLAGAAGGGAAQAR